MEAPGRPFLELRGSDQTYERGISALDPRTVDPLDVGRTCTKAAAEENDETNAPMLAVNERLGYRPLASVYSYAREPL